MPTWVQRYRSPGGSLGTPVPTASTMGWVHGITPRMYTISMAAGRHQHVRQAIPYRHQVACTGFQSSHQYSRHKQPTMPLQSSQRRSAVGINVTRHTTPRWGEQHRQLNTEMAGSPHACNCIVEEYHWPGKYHACQSPRVNGTTGQWAEGRNVTGQAWCGLHAPPPGTKLTVTGHR